MLIIASRNGAIGIDKAMNTLKNGGSALDAVETGIRQVEANPAEHSVGYNGYPNIVGELELDASIMDGAVAQFGRGRLDARLPLRDLSRPSRSWSGNCRMCCWPGRALSVSRVRLTPNKGKRCSLRRFGRSGASAWRM